MDKFRASEIEMDGVLVYHKIYCHYVAMNKENITNVCTKLMIPTQAKHDHEVYDEVVKWEDSYRDAVSRGMEDFGETAKKVALNRIASTRLRELLT